MTKPPDAHCVICGDADPLDLDVCMACGGASHDSGDTLVFLESTRSSARKHMTLNALRNFIGHRQMPADPDYLGSGHQALVRLPRETAFRVVESLAAEGISAVTRSAAFSLTSLPTTFYGLLAATAIIGMLTGLTADALFLWTTPAMTAGLWLAAQLRMRHPAISSDRTDQTFPKEVRSEILATFAQLSDGSARMHLADFVRAAEPLFKLPEVSVTPADLARLVSSSCEAALELEAMETCSANLEDTDGRRRAALIENGMTAQFRDAIMKIRRLRRL